MEDWVLLVIVIVVVYLFATGYYKRLLDMTAHMAPSASADVAPASADQAAPSTSAPVSASAPAATAAGVAEMKREGLEAIMIDDGIRATNGEACIAGSAVATPYATTDYGRGGMQFTDWAIGATIDPKIIESNKQFVAERMRNTATWTGATYSPDSHDTYDAVPWRGLTRPSAVFVGSPDQMPDIDMKRNPKTQRVRWDSAVSS